MREQGRQAALPGLRCGISLCPLSSLPAGTVLGACGSPWDQICPFRREGDCGKQGLPLQSSPGLGRASGQALVSEEEPSPRAAPRTSSVFSSDSVRPHGLQPTRPLCPWDFPGKSTGVGCHCLLHIHLSITFSFALKNTLVFHRDCVASVACFR